MEMQEFLVDRFELRKMDRFCNTNGCMRKPMKQVLIEETDVVSSDRRELVSLFFCNDHYRSALSESLNDMNSINGPDKVLSKRVFEIGYVTY
jgi:hypothetical protein